MADKKSDPWKWPAALLLWLALGWVAWQCASTMMSRNAVVQDLNQAAAISDSDPKRAMALITGVQREQVARSGGTGERFLDLVGLKTPSFAEQYGTIYANVGQGYYAEDEVELAIRAWSLALVNNPKQQIDGPDLAAACTRTENWEFGYYAGVISGSRGAMFKKFFGKRYNPPWD